MLTYSSAPWSVEGHTIKDASGKTIARVEKAAYDTQEFEDRKADLRLIANAPDLYDALNELMKKIMWGGNATTELERAERIIAQVEGKT